MQKLIFQKCKYDIWWKTDVKIPYSFRFSEILYVTDYRYRTD